MGIMRSFSRRPMGARWCTLFGAPRPAPLLFLSPRNWARAEGALPLFWLATLFLDGPTRPERRKERAPALLALQQQPKRRSSSSRERRGGGGVLLLQIRPKKKRKKKKKKRHFGREERKKKGGRPPTTTEIRPGQSGGIKRTSTPQVKSTRMHSRGLAGGR